MIYTMTLNPALDYIVGLEHYQPGMVNRTTSERLLAGGKGINVSIVLQHIGVDSTALGFLAGPTGDMISSMLEQEGIRQDFVRLAAGNSRINLKLKAGEETEINGMGPQIAASDTEQLFWKLDTLQEGDILVLAGSVPRGLPDTIYCTMMERLCGRKIRFAVDTTGNLLLKALSYQPFLIKPNHHELGELFGKVLRTDAEIEACARQLQAMGAEQVLVSMAGEGAMLLDAQGCVHRREAPVGTVVNSTGAGDSMLAGFLAGWLEYAEPERAFCKGIAAGSASAFSEFLASKEAVDTLYRQLITQ